MFKLLFGTKLVFDHHDVCPELYEAKFARKGMGFRITCLLERWSMRAADLVIATNESYRRIALGRGGKDPATVFVVRNGPNLVRLRPLPDSLPEIRSGFPRWLCRRYWRSGGASDTW